MFPNTANKNKPICCYRFFFLWLFSEYDGASGDVPGSGVKESSESTVSMKNVEENKCEPNPCQNGGVCVQNYNFIDGYQCQCADDFGGITCNGMFCSSCSIFSQSLHGR